MPTEPPSRMMLSEQREGCAARHMSLFQTSLLKRSCAKQEVAQNKACPGHHDGMARHTDSSYFFGQCQGAPCQITDHQVLFGTDAWLHHLTGNFTGSLFHPTKDINVSGQNLPDRYPHESAPAGKRCFTVTCPACCLKGFHKGSRGNTLPPNNSSCLRSTHIQGTRWLRPTRSQICGIRRGMPQKISAGVTSDISGS